MELRFFAGARVTGCAHKKELQQLQYLVFFEKLKRIWKSAFSLNVFNRHRRGRQISFEFPSRLVGLCSASFVNFCAIHGIPNKMQRIRCVQIQQRSSKSKPCLIGIKFGAGTNPPGPMSSWIPNPRSHGEIGSRARVDNQMTENNLAQMVAIFFPLHISPGFGLAAKLYMLLANLKKEKKKRCGIHIK